MYFFIRKIRSHPPHPSHHEGAEVIFPPDYAEINRDAMPRTGMLSGHNDGIAVENRLATAFTKAGLGGVGRSQFLPLTVT